MPTTSVRRLISLFKRSCGLVLQIWRQSSLAEVPEGQQVTTGLLEVVSSLGQLPSQRVNHSLELSLHLGGVRLVEDGAHQGCHPRLLGLGHLGQEIPQIVGTTPLPGDPGLADRKGEPLVGISSSRAPPRKSPRATSERQQASQPALSLAGGDLDAEDLSGGPQH